MRNDNWIVSRAPKNSASSLSQAQLRLLECSLHPNALLLLRQALRELVNNLAEYELNEFLYESHRFILYKDKDYAVVALSTVPEQDPLHRKTPDPSLEDSYFIAESKAMKQIMGIIQKVSYVDSTVLLLGKSGVGKGAIARLIHKYSKREAETFISVNCGAIPESLMEAELFGYESGSFTGGNKEGKKGLFETANKGTLFLDEIGELPYILQVKLLEVLQEKQIRRVGGTENIPINVRIIAATNQNLAQLVEKKRFREDLYYRLNVVPIEIPPLKDRKEDILPLTQYFLKKYAGEYKKYKTLHPEVWKVFGEYDWPGNVRELENMIERLVITTENQEIQLSDLPPSIFLNATQILDPFLKNEIIPLKQAKKMLEDELILKAYKLYKSSYKAAEVLGVNQSTVAKKIKELRNHGW